MKRTPNAQRPTSNVQRGKAWIGLIAGSLFTAIAALGAIAPEIAEAVRPMSEGVPEVAVLRLRPLLAAKLAATDEQIVREKLSEALLASGQPEEALKILDQVGGANTRAARFLRAQALAALHRWAEALPVYDQVATETALPLRAEAIFGRGEALRSLGRLDDALQAFKLLFSDAQWKASAELRAAEIFLDKHEPAPARRLLQKTKPTALADKKEKRFLQGRLEAEMGRPERAIELYQTIVRRPEGATHAVLIANLCALAEANLQAGTPEAGDDALEDFVEHHPGDPELPRMFAKLDQLYRAERQHSSHDLGRWGRDPLQPRRALAQWYLARSELRAGRRDNALRIFGELENSTAKFPFLAEALCEYAELRLQNRQFDEALATLEKARGLGSSGRVREQIDLMVARVDYEARRFDAAGDAFEKVAHSVPQLAQDSLFNASLAWLEAANDARFAQNSTELSKSNGTDENRGELILERGLAEAGRGDKQAVATLEEFLRQFPKHKRASEALVALAELAFHHAPPNLDEARKHLGQARSREMNAAASERADYLQIWLEDSSPENTPQKVADAATNFLQKYPASAFVPDVRMKLAETYYRQQDFPNAQTQFQILAQENPRAPFTEKALFFAGKSAAKSMAAESLDRALVLFDEVFKKNGELKWAARNEQALIERKLGKPQDAATLYEEVVKGGAKPEEKREALCGKADILSEDGGSEQQNYQNAIAIYDELAKENGIPPHWRNQALFKKGICLEKLGDPAAALAALYTVIEEPTRPDRPRQEFFWYYKAGFNAARLLEEDSKWQSAAAVYQRLASAGGTRSDEAKARLSRLRLEHFLWEQ